MNIILLQAIFIYSCTSLHGSVRSFVTDYGSSKIEKPSSIQKSKAPDKTLSDAMARSQTQQNKAAQLIQKNYKKSKNLPLTPALEISKPKIDQEIVHIRSFFNFGHPTEMEIKQLFQSQFFSENIIDTIEVQEVKGGAFSEKVYALLVDSRPIFFIKISSQQDAHQRLIELQQSPIGRLQSQAMYKDAELRLHVNRNDLPILSWVEKVFIEQDIFGRENILEVTHAARGKSAQEILFSKSAQHTTSDQAIRKHIQQKKEAEQRECLYQIGKSLGSFQQVFMQQSDPMRSETWTTAAHNDLHASNVFYDSASKKVTFIDNESMQLGQSMLQDVNNFLAVMTLGIKNSQDMIPSWSSIKIDTIATTNLLSTYSILFLQGYLESFSPEQRKIIATTILEQNNKFTTHNNVTLNIYYSPGSENIVHNFLRKIIQDSDRIIT